MKLQKGDYASIKGLDDEQCERLTQAFYAQGAQKYGDKDEREEFPYIVWDEDGDLVGALSPRIDSDCQRYVTYQYALACHLKKHTDKATSIQALKQARDNLDASQEVYNEVLKAVQDELGDKFTLEGKDA